MPHLPTFHDWIGSLGEDRLAELLAANSLVLRWARVRDLDELASRLTHPAMVSTALTGSPLPLLQVVQTVQAMGLAATTDRLAAVLEVTSAEHHDQVRTWVDRAISLALVWPDEERLRVNPGLPSVIPMPLGLAGTAAHELVHLTVDTLRTMARALGVDGAGRKDELVGRVTAALSDSESIRRTVSEAPDDVLTTVTETVAQRLGEVRRSVVALGTDPDDTDEETYGPGWMQAYQAERTMLAWMQSAGLALHKPHWGHYGTPEIPSEVYLALAPPQFRVPFAPQPPAVSSRPLPLEQIGRSAAAAAAEFLATAMAVLEGVARQPLKAIKSGGIGARELARHAKAVGAEPSAVRLSLTLAVGVGLLDESEPGLLTVADSFTQWRRRSPAERAADLCAAWLPLSVPPTLDRDPDRDDKSLPVLSPDPPHSTMPLGLLLCSLLTDRPGQEVFNPSELLAVVAWQHPLGRAPAGAGLRAWAEGHQLGILADGAITPLGQAILSGSRQRAVETLDAMLPEVSGQALIGSDLTILVPGSPDPTLVDVLDVLAVRETRGAANTWRVTPDSVRGALDSGYSAEDLLQALQSIARKELPQALDYVIRDVARRHGHLTVRPAASVILADDEALLAEVVATRGLRKLGLRLVAPTVALSSANSDIVLSSLRSAGYLPVMADGETSAVQVRRLPGPAAPHERHDVPGPGAGALDQDSPVTSAGRQLATSEDPLAAARRLLGAEETVGPVSAEMSDVELQLGFSCRRLSAAEVHELADAIEQSRQVVIGYLSSSGAETLRLISDLLVVGNHLSAYCHLSHDERTFRLDRILSVAPA